MKEKILNLTQHEATPDQISDGVFEPSEKDLVKALITFTRVPTVEEMLEKAGVLARIALREEASAAMIGGAPYFMAPLERALIAVNVRPCYSFTERRSSEIIDPVTGEVKKTQLFVHAGWVWV